MRDIKKEYPLEIMNVGKDVYQLMSWGHHDFQKFMKKVEDGYPTWPMGKPEHVYMVKFPMAGYKFACKECSESHPRAIPATVTTESNEPWPSGEL